MHGVTSVFILFLRFDIFFGNFSRRDKCLRDGVYFVII